MLVVFICYLLFSKHLVRSEMGVETHCKRGSHLESGNTSAKLMHSALISKKKNKEKLKGKIKVILLVFDHFSEYQESTQNGGYQ